MSSQSNRYIIAGTSGTGKTTLINYLQSLDFQVYPEPIRYVLEQQLNINGEALPSKNALLFLQTIREVYLDDLKAAQSIPGPVFFDRGLPDIMAYALRFGVETSLFELSSSVSQYSQRVFLLPPWKEIFVQDHIRGKSFEEYQLFHNLIVTSYQDLGFELITVPRDSVRKRAQFIFLQIKKDQHH